MPTFLKSASRKAVLDALFAHYGDRKTALIFNNPFELLVAVVLSAQCTDKQVNKVTGPLFEALPTPESLAALSADEFQPWIKSIGFAATKAKHLVETARLLVERHSSQVPNDFNALVALPGVGRKSANVILSVAFGVPAIAVDTHVFRVSNRLGLADASSVELTEQQLMKHIPKQEWAAAHHWLIWHGRELCKAPTPKCQECFLTEWCHYFNGVGRWRKVKPASRPLI
jgi:endonuclease-3